MKSYLKEAEDRLIALVAGRTPTKWKAEDYIGAGESSLRYLNLKIPTVRQAFKQGFTFSKRPPEEQWPIWDYIWQNSDYFEVMLLASYFAASRPVAELVEKDHILLSWLKRVDNWAHSDELSSHYSKMLEFNQRKLLPVFRRWSVSKNPWEKRQSMVGLQYYARQRRKRLPCATLLQFIERHMDDEHYYVQKGVGWALRESWNAYPKPTYAYLKKNAHRIPPAGWTAATEKLSPKEKAELSRRRRLGRV